MKIDAFLDLKPTAAKLSGESTDKVFTKSIQITEFDTGRSHTRGSGDLPPMSDKLANMYAPFVFQVRKDVDAATPHLFDAYCTTWAGWIVPGVNQFTQADISFRKAGEKTVTATAISKPVYLKFTFEKLLLISYSLGSSYDGVPTETVKFAFQTVKLRYEQQTQAGGTKPPPEMKGWDFAGNVPV